MEAALGQAVIRCRPPVPVDWQQHEIPGGCVVTLQVPRSPELHALPRPPPLKCPMHILGHARAEWKRVVAELRRLGLSAAVAPAALETYATIYALWRKAKTELIAAGEP